MLRDSIFGLCTKGLKKLTTELVSQQLKWQLGQQPGPQAGYTGSRQVNIPVHSRQFDQQQGQQPLASISCRSGF